MGDCIFCKIADKKIPSKAIFEDSKLYCFEDLEPQAPVHVLIIPKKHIASLDDLTEEDEQLMGHLICKIRDIAKYLNLEKGYRLVSNCGEDGLQTVAHVHFHLLGKRKMIWPPG